MKIYFGINNYQRLDQDLYLALGNFDGVHRGHQRLIGAATERASQREGLAGALVFDPHPAQILTPAHAPQLLVSSASKAVLLESAGLDVLIYHPFSKEMAQLSPQAFVENILVKSLHVKEVFVGFNYTFGHKGEGNPELLKKLGEIYGFAVHVIDPVLIDGDLVSSSLIRQLLGEGNIKRAIQMLGYAPFIEGEVVEGDNRGGSLLGFPTANIQVPAYHAVPANGVYAAYARLQDESTQHLCVVNIGQVPTFHDDNSPVSVEAHILGFDQQIYGETITLYFLERLRSEKRFDSVDDLIMQINEDCKQAVEIAGRSNNKGLN